MANSWFRAISAVVPGTINMGPAHVSTGGDCGDGKGRMEGERRAEGGSQTAEGGGQE